MDAKPTHWCPFKNMHRCSTQGEGQVHIQAGTGELHPQAKQCQGFQTTPGSEGKGMEQIPQSLCLNLDFGLLVFREDRFLLFPKPPDLW